MLGRTGAGKYLATIACALLCAACGGGASAPLPLSDGGTLTKGRALFYVEPISGLCTNLSIDIAQKGATGFTTIKQASVHYGMLTATKIASVDLDPGTYEIIAAACVRSDYATARITGVTNNDGAFLKPATIRESLGSFSVAAGEVVMIGNLQFINKLGDATKTEGIMLVEDIPEKRLADLRSSSPDLAARTVKRHAVPTYTDAELAAIETRLTEGNSYGWAKLERALLLNSIRTARSRVSASR